MQAEKMTWLAEKAKMLAAFRPFKVRKTAIQKGILELMMGVEPITSSLPTRRDCDSKSRETRCCADFPASLFMMRGDLLCWLPSELPSIPVVL